MLDHMTFRVTDIQRAKAFYSAALAPLGYSVCFEGNYGMNIVGFAYPDPAEPNGKKDDVWFIDGPSPYGGPPATTGHHRLPPGLEGPDPRPGGRLLCRRHQRRRQGQRSPRPAP